jgi:hypothetical protein
MHPAVRIVARFEYEVIIFLKRIVWLNSGRPYFRLGGSTFLGVLLELEPVAGFLPAGCVLLRPFEAFLVAAVRPAWEELVRPEVDAG